MLIGNANRELRPFLLHVPISLITRTQRSGVLLEASAMSSTRLSGVLFRRTIRGGHASLAIVVTSLAEDGERARSPPKEERMVLVIVRLGGAEWSAQGDDGKERAARLRSDVRRMCKLGHELEFEGRFDGGSTSSREAGGAPPMTDWRAWENFIVDYHLPASPSDESNVRVRRELAWDAARCQRTRAKYFAAPPAKQPSKARAKAATSVESDAARSVDRQSRQKDEAARSAARHHGGGIGKRRQGEIVADFLLWMLSTAGLRGGDDTGSEAAEDGVHDDEGTPQEPQPRRRLFMERWVPLPSSVAARATRAKGYAGEVEVKDEAGRDSITRTDAVGKKGAARPSQDTAHDSDLPPSLAGGVVDAAGGAGHVSLALALRGVRSTVVDPRRTVGQLPGRDRKALRKAGVPPFAAYRAWFGSRPPGVDGLFREGAATYTGMDGRSATDPTLLPVCSMCSEDRLLADCAALVALHPDEATGAIVETAVEHEIPFLVVPCCVFSRLFPERRRAPGGGDGGPPVRTYDDLLDWLVARHPAIRTTRLPFDGANVAVWATFK